MQMTQKVNNILTLHNVFARECNNSSFSKGLLKYYLCSTYPLHYKIEVYG